MQQDQSFSTKRHMLISVSHWTVSPKFHYMHSAPPRTPQRFSAVNFHSMRPTSATEPRGAQRSMRREWQKYESQTKTIHIRIQTENKSLIFVSIIFLCQNISTNRMSFSSSISSWFLVTYEDIALLDPQVTTFQN